MTFRLAKFGMLTALSLGLMLAQRPSGPGGMGPGGQGGPGPGNFDPATMIQRRVDMLTRLLSLTDAQKSQATTIFTNAQTAIQPLHDNMRQARQTLSDAVKSNTAANIDSASQTIGTLTGQITAAQSKADAAFYAILTPDQQAKLNQAGPRGGAMFPGGMMMGRPRGPRNQ